MEGMNDIFTRTFEFKDENNLHTSSPEDVNKFTISVENSSYGLVKLWADIDSAVKFLKQRKIEIAIVKMDNSGEYTRENINRDLAYDAGRAFQQQPAGNQPTMEMITKLGEPGAESVLAAWKAAKQYAPGLEKGQLDLHWSQAHHRVSNLPAVRQMCAAVVGDKLYRLESKPLEIRFGEKTSASPPAPCVAGPAFRRNNPTDDIRMVTPLSANYTFTYYSGTSSNNTMHQLIKLGVSNNEPGDCRVPTETMQAAFASYTESNNAAKKNHSHNFKDAKKSRYHAVKDSATNHYHDFKDTDFSSVMGEAFATELASDKPATNAHLEQMFKNMKRPDLQNEFLEVRKRNSVKKRVPFRCRVQIPFGYMLLVAGSLVYEVSDETAGLACVVSPMAHARIVPEESKQPEKVKPPNKNLDANEKTALARVQDRLPWRDGSADQTPGERIRRLNGLPFGLPSGTIQTLRFPLSTEIQILHDVNLNMWWTIKELWGVPNDVTWVWESRSHVLGKTKPSFVVDTSRYFDFRPGQPSEPQENHLESEIDFYAAHRVNLALFKDEVMEPPKKERAKSTKSVRKPRGKKRSDP